MTGWSENMVRDQRSSKLLFGPAIISWVNQRICLTDVYRKERP